MDIKVTSEMIGDLIHRVEVEIKTADEEMLKIKKRVKISEAQQKDLKKQLKALKKEYKKMKKN